MTGWLRGLCGLSICLFAGLAFSVSSAAATGSAGFTVESFAAPTHFSSGNEFNSYRVFASNVGSVSTSGPVTLTDTLPEGTTPEPGGIKLVWSTTVGEGEHLTEEYAEKYCTSPSVQVVQCTFPEALAPDAWLELNVHVTVDEAKLVPGSLLTNKATTAGGGGESVSTESHNEVDPVPAAFGVSSFDLAKNGQDGMPETQAGAHPYELTTTIDLNNAFRENGPQGPKSTDTTSVQDVKDVVVDLPLGFVGSALAAPDCTLAQLSSGSAGEGGCASDTVVGHIFTEPVGSASVNSPIYNLVPEQGVPAEFGYVDALNVAHVIYVHIVPTPAGYVLQTTSPEIPAVDLAHISVSFYGDPAARDTSGNAQVLLFTNPTDCSGAPQVATMYMDSWENPGTYDAEGTPNVGDGKWVSATASAPPVTGCNALEFAPELYAQPTTHEADAPSGLEFELRVAQAETTGTRATPALKKAVVTLPEGMTIDPSAANGLGVCSEAQIGWMGASLYDFTSAPPECPDSSKVGSLELETPLLARKLEGEVYLATQNENPFGSTFALYLVIDDPVTGVLVKVPGELKADPQTGRIVASFSENPQLPFSDLKLHFFGGPRAQLTTPANCGAYSTGGELTPWSAPDSGPIGAPSDSFAIDESCTQGFAPTFSTGSTIVQAGAYTSVVASFSRSDTDRELGGLTLSLPPGLLADIASVPLCPEAQANAGTCPESTQVGNTEAGSGPGPSPLFLPGKVYLTGPYNGGPYGLSIVVPADPSPFDFGTVVVRQSLRVDPLTAAVTDVSDPFPRILDVTGANGQVSGIPIKLRRVDVSIDRPGFAFNPTNCNRMQAAATITSVLGDSVSLATPFQLTNCAHLKFEPKLSASTSGKTSKALGASLTTKVSYPSQPQGAEANIGLVKVELPVELPSELKTLQKACLAAQFAADPAQCPAASVVGHAVVHTPILPAPLQGPAIFVSHGGEAFPSLVIVLQGDGVTIDLVGTTFISKAGITSTTFKAVPDTPFSSFELTLPEGRFSALAAHGNLCTEASKLLMPVTFVAQDGAEVHQSTPISVTGCAAHISIKRKKLVGTRVSVTVVSSLAGRVTISGRGIRETTKKLSAGTHTLLVALSAGARSMLLKHRRHHELEIRAKLRTGRHTVSSKVARLTL